jgi:hypothetical protein
MAELSKEEQDKIIQALDRVGATKPCPRCGNPTFSLVGGYFNHFVQQSLSGVSLGGPSIPTAVVVCSNCGWVAEHALGALKLLPKDQSAKPEGEK